jgi:hypothetical protein
MLLNLKLNQNYILYMYLVTSDCSSGLDERKPDFVYIIYSRLDFIYT